MSETTLTAIVVAALASLPPTMVALKGLLETRRNRKEVTAAVNQTAAQNDVLLDKSAEIHTLVNKNYDEMKTELAAAKQEIAGLKELVAQLLTDRDERRADKH